MALLLVARDLDIRYGRVEAVRGISLELARGEIVAVLGANGAGKSSLLRALLGVQRLTGGGIEFDGRDITAWPASRRVQAGLVLVPEGRRIIATLTVQENLLMGAFNRRLTRALFLEIDEIYARFPNLAARRNSPAAVLSGGEQQMLAIGRAMMNFPRLLMLDEPSLGLSPLLAELVFERLAEIQRQGTTILLVEQNATCLEMATEGIILANGQVVLAGNREMLQDSEFVRRAYLGV
jgi:branched-chain amino acid transport system ATP-binding protein